MDDTIQNTNQTSKFEIPEEVEPYLEGLLADAGVKLLASEIVDHMPPEHLESFIKLNESGAQRQEIEKFVKEHIPNSEEVFANAFLEFRDILLGNTALVNHAPSNTSGEEIKTAN